LFEGGVERLTHGPRLLKVLVEFVQQKGKGHPRRAVLRWPIVDKDISA